MNNAESGSRRSKILILALSWLMWLPGCTLINPNYLSGVVYASNPRLNSFSSTIVSEPDLHEHPPRYDKLVFLIHGWHGDASSFSDLGVLLQRDLVKTHSLYTLSYWSNPLFYGPNFQRIGDLGESLSNLLRAAIKDQRQRGQPIQEISLITHSMGGLIARDAILRMAEAQDDSLAHLKIKLVLAGTPTQGADAATIVEKIINGATSPVTWVASLFIHLWYPDRALVWDRQVHDMRHLEKINHTRALTPTFIADQTFRWNRLLADIDTLAVIGVDDIDKPLPNEEDGIVHGIDVPFNSAPLTRRCYVTQRHWDGIVSIESRDHEVYPLLKEMVAGQQGSTALYDMCAKGRNGRLPTWVIVAMNTFIDDSDAAEQGMKINIAMAPFDNPELHFDWLPKWALDAAVTSADVLYAVFVGGPAWGETDKQGSSRARNILGAYMLFWPRSDGQEITEVRLDVRVGGDKSPALSLPLLLTESGSRVTPEPAIRKGETNFFWLSKIGDGYILCQDTARTKCRALTQSGLSAQIQQ